MSLRLPYHQAVRHDVTALTVLPDNFLFAEMTDAGDAACLTREALGVMHGDARKNSIILSHPGFAAPLRELEILDRFCDGRRVKITIHNPTEEKIGRVLRSHFERHVAGDKRRDTKSNPVPLVSDTDLAMIAADLAGPLPDLRANPNCKVYSVTMIYCPDFGPKDPDAGALNFHIDPNMGDNFDVRIARTRFGNATACVADTSLVLRPDKSRERLVEIEGVAEPETQVPVFCGPDYSMVLMRAPSSHTVKIAGTPSAHAPGYVRPAGSDQRRWVNTYDVAFV